MALTPINVSITVAFMHSCTKANVKSRTYYLRYKNKALKVPNLSVQLAFSFRSIFFPFDYCFRSIACKGNGNFFVRYCHLPIFTNNAGWYKKVAK